MDEAHERSLNIDFLLGYLKQLLPARPDLKVVITSATLDAERFARHFGTAAKPAPVIEVSGRMFPVDVRYRPLRKGVGDAALPGEVDDEEELEEAIVDTAEDLWREGPGDILVFLPGEREIRRPATLRRGLARFLCSGDRNPAAVRAPSAPNNSASRARRRLAHRARHHVAETSLTVPGTRYVITCGLARQRYSPQQDHAAADRKVSQASANQRAGRCGRVAEGICVRLR